ncbi:MAG: C4-dicarboxylate ABC transporter substrate-binding protein, partial [Dehalobacterium sp.]
MQKRYLVLIAMILMASLMLFTGCGNGNKEEAANNDDKGTQGEVITLKLGHHAGQKTPFHLGGQKFADLVSERTNGAVKIDIYPDSTLGGAVDLME